MTPTLLGRWHTRLLLFACIGIPVSLAYGGYLGAVVGSPRTILMLDVGFDPLPLIVICLTTLAGFAMDPLYIAIQRLRWDRDWPFAFQFVAMLTEFLIVLCALRAEWLPRGLGGPLGDQDYLYIYLHYATVFILSFLALLGLIQIHLIRWRYKGAELGGF